MAIKPYSGSSDTRLENLINANNAEQVFQGVDYTFDIPGVNTTSEPGNTAVVLKPIETDKYRNTTITYDRLPLSVLSDLPSGEITPVQVSALPFSIHDILTDINSALGLDLSTEEVEDKIYTEKQDTYVLSVKQSLAWLDSSFAFPAEHPQSEIQLSEVIQNTELTGLTFTG